MKNMFFVLSVLLFLGCAGETSDEPSNQTTERPTANISAYVLDGPCLAGANVEAKMLVKETLAQTEEIYLSTTGSYGYFDIATSADLEATPYALVKITDAECFNEVEGVMMQGKTYYGMIDLTSSAGRNVHPQTKGTIDRTVELYTNPSSETYQDFTASQIQAEQEWMAIFGITDVSTRFGDMALDGVSDGNAALLTMNIIHLYGNTEAEQAALIQSLSDDYKLDGTLDDADLINTLRENSKGINLPAVRENLAARYSQLGLSIEVPNFEPLVDSDGDGILNKDDDNTPDTISFSAVTDGNLSTMYESTVTIQGITGTIPVIGSAYHNGVLKTNFNATNDDEIKLSLTSPSTYSTSTSASITISGVNYTYTVTTKADDRDQIIVFDSGQPTQDGDFGYANAQAWCNAEATAQGLTGTITPWLSNSAFDSGTDFAPFTPDAVNPRQVQSLTGGLIASKWTEFFNAEGTDTLQTLGVVDDGYWTGMVSGPSYDGRATYNCDQWTRNGNIVNDLDYGNFNRHDIADRTTEGSPQGVNTTTCDQLKKILCIAY